MFRRVLKVLGLLVCFVLGALLLGALWIHEPVPGMTPGDQGDEKASLMLQALNQPGWNEIEVIEWTFVGLRSYRWNKRNNTVVVRWGSKEVWVDLARQTGDVRSPIGRAGDMGLVQNAIDAFNNDSFWLAAPYKVFDPGTQRSWVTLEDGREGLMVTYSQGGSTPGDTYVWLLDSENRPIGLKLWVSVIPIGGLEVSWEQYKVFPNGSRVAQSHRGLGGVNITLSNIAIEGPERPHPN